MATKAKAPAKAKAKPKAKKAVVVPAEEVAVGSLVGGKVKVRLTGSKAQVEKELAAVLPAPPKPKRRPPAMYLARNSSGSYRLSGGEPALNDYGNYYSYNSIATFCEGDFHKVTKYKLKKKTFKKVRIIIEEVGE